MNQELLKFPIGEYSSPTVITSDLIEESINSITNFPQQLSDCVASFNEEQFDTPYRSEGWTVRQLINHCADSHMNSYVRFKWSLTEETPTIKAYDQNNWAELSDSINCDPKHALQMLHGIHARWSFLLRSLTEQELNRCFFHPETKKLVSIKENICIYAWHGKHHLAHVIELKKRMNW